MIAGRILRANAVAVLLTLLFVPALTQPSRHLTAGPVNQGSSFSRIGVLSTDRVPAAVPDAAPVAIAADVPPRVLAAVSAGAAPPRDADPIPLVTFTPPSPLRAPPISPRR